MVSHHQLWIWIILFTDKWVQNLSGNITDKLSIKNGKTQNKFPDNDFLMVYEFYVRLYDVDIKVKSNFLPNPNLTRKIEFESKEVQIVEPDFFWLLMLRSGWNFGSDFFRFKPWPHIEIGRRQCIDGHYRPVQFELFNNFNSVETITRR